MARFRTVSDQKLSLWQSAVTEAMKRLQGKNSTTGSQPIMNHPKVQAATEHVVRATAADSKDMTPPGRSPGDFELNVYLSHLMYQLAIAKFEKKIKKARNLEEEIRKYSSDDIVGWSTCVTTFLEYLYSKKTPYYRDWKDHGPIDSYGVISYKLPNDAKVAIIGDWGTGMPDAKAMLTSIITEHNPDAIIHLGDIYYSGTLKESKEHITDLFNDVFRQTKTDPIPVFSIPGNHDYYAFGNGFYHQVIDVMNASNPSWKQEASYFCLQTEDTKWQLLGMDTGRHDYNPMGDFLVSDTGPWLEQSEAEWHADKLEQFPGSTILFSHHQLFSQHSVIQKGQHERPWLNEHLFGTFSPYFDRIAAWFWGHEHNLVFFEDDVGGLKKGRLVGCSAFEVSENQNPYEPHNTTFKDQVPMIPNMPHLTSNQGYYYHGYAILDFSARILKNNAIKSLYYEFPSWGPIAPKVKDQISKKMSEEIIEYHRHPLPPKPKEPVKNGDEVLLVNQAGKYISKNMTGEWPTYYNYPTCQSKPLKLTLGFIGSNKSRKITSGDNVYLQCTEADEELWLGAWEDRSALYFFKKNHDIKKQGWQLKKCDPSNEQIKYGDKVYIVNHFWSDQKMCQDANWLTTKTDTLDVWTIIKANTYTINIQKRHENRLGD